jgi:hypothetical protein
MNQRKVVAYNRYIFESDDEYIETDFDDFVDGHGTHVMASAVGHGGNHTSSAPGAKLLVMDLGYQDDNENLIFIPQDIQDHLLRWLTRYTSSRILSVSWGTDLNSYTETARQMDAHVYEHPSFVIIVANGNDGERGQGTVGTPATAKNVISVGATYNVHDAYRAYRDDALWVDEGGFPFFHGSLEDLGPHAVAAFSSRGPTEDGRIKPDILAPGSPILSARAHSGCNSMIRHGTSMAAPLVAGMVAHLRSILGGAPSAALIKALLISSAVPASSIVGFETNVHGKLIPTVLSRDPTPFDYGFGVTTMPSLTTTVYFEDTLQPGEVHVYEGSTAANASLTLVWTDPPSPLNAHHMLVHNLDLEVWVDGRKYWGNHGANPDIVNNVEKVRVGGAFTTLRVYVRGTYLMEEQAFSLVSTVRVEHVRRLSAGECGSQPQQPCHVDHGGGVQYCLNDTWGECHPQFCMNGFLWKNGHCVPPETLGCQEPVTDCAVHHGHGLWCRRKYTGLVLCMVTRCSTGFIRRNNACICVQDQTCGDRGLRRCTDGDLGACTAGRRPIPSIYWLVGVGGIALFCWMRGLTRKRPEPSQPNKRTFPILIKPPIKKI